MKRFTLAAALAASTVFVMPASAAVLVNGAANVAPTPFSTISATQGTLLASTAFAGSALTFAATFNQAVYRNTFGTLDFYFQVLRTGPGTNGDSEEIRRFTVSSFTGYGVDGFVSATDPDAGGIFIAANNPNLDDGTPSGSTTTFNRSLSGGVVGVDFGLNGLSRTENSATYIFRTNATQFDALGTFGIIDGSTMQGSTYEPIGAPQLPEPATWGTMLLGFGIVGRSLRRRTRHAVRFA